MFDYQLEVKQIVKFPRCRIYRQFIRTLMEDRTIRVSGRSGLFYFTVLCSYANFRTSYRRLGCINYTVYPGEWVCTLKEMMVWFRARSRRQVLEILDDLQAQRRIIYKRLGHGKIIKYKIIDWQRHNTALEYNAPCQKETGFFFMPIATASELISMGRCSEMDIILDLWTNTIYNDEQVQGSDIGPVAYMRNGTGSPLIGYSELAARWGISKATVCRTLKRLESREYLSLFSYPGRQGSVIYLRSYLSTMFQVSDILLDKEEVAMTLNISCTQEELKASDAKLIESVSDSEACVSNPADFPLIGKAQKLLSNQGFSCFGCPEAIYKLSPLSGCMDESFGYRKRLRPEGMPPFRLSISCKGEIDLFVFEIYQLPAIGAKYGGKTNEKP